ncbi:MAG: hypothetical protein JWO68_3841, partial [Actinomycetia bacterium]|nr:hypothetical protein [Actinomycetes bacterium]
MGARRRSLVLLVAAVTVAGACGSRLPDQTLKAIDANLTSGGRSAADATGLAAGTGDTGAAAAAEPGTGAAAP